MTANRKRIGIVAAGTLAQFVALAAHSAVNVQSHTPVANTSYVLTEDAMMEVLPWDSTGRRWFFGANYNWVNDPLVELNEARTYRTGLLVDSINSLDLTAGLVLDRRFSLNMTLPVHVAHVPGEGYSTALGDVRLFAKYRLTSDGAAVAFSVIPELRLPTGSSQLFLSDSSLSPGVTLAAERDFDYFRVSANIGYRYSGGASYRDLNYAQRLPIGVGVYVPLSERWGANGEATGALTLPRNAYQNPGEFYAGARYLVSRDLVATGGFSVGALSGDKSNDFRALLGLKYSPLAEPSVPSVTPVMAKAGPEEKKAVFTSKQIFIKEEVKFQHNMASLTNAGKRVLNDVADVILENHESFKQIVIEGHTNELGAIPYNDKLSVARAKSVRAYLITRGVPKASLDTAGFGELRPKKLPGFPKPIQLELNRRVEFKVVN